ncbi:DUF1496 domain-containing protein [Nitrosococcus wardiae]|uniref:DUF1496 domain-containing protein n=1 Tax=Nitrosococcus wardiae TaxID=1814290 RepID=A0A4P7BWS3_9GAMM|nr:DUF1496 domain-containing protein [Nitrosococcus wardiae]QBQ54548.1 DUF1496 domain-containing protein [Nitrosococcus wardiae]
MPESSGVPNVGAPDPELKNSPIALESDEETEVLRLEVPGEPVCYFNNQSYKNGTHVCSSGVLLRCDYGVWVRVGPCDPDNP